MQVTILPECRKPAPKRPRNQPWFQDVILTERVLDSFQNVEERPFPPSEFANEV